MAPYQHCHTAMCRHARFLLDEGNISGTATMFFSPVPSPAMGLMACSTTRQRRNFISCNSFSTPLFEVVCKTEAPGVLLLGSHSTGCLQIIDCIIQELAK